LQNPPLAKASVAIRTLYRRNVATNNLNKNCFGAKYIQKLLRVRQRLDELYGASWRKLRKENGPSHKQKVWEF
jgi:hypothetical protein